MAQGFSLTRHDGFAACAEAFVAAGVAVLVYDHRFLGDSGGYPRQKVALGEQLRDRRAAVAFVRKLEGIDPNRIVLWGFSLGGMSVIRAAASDRQIGGAILMSPMTDGLARLVAGLRDDPRHVAWLFGRSLVAGFSPAMQIPVTASPGGRAVMPFLGAADGFFATLRSASPWRNSVLAHAMPRVALSRPANAGRRVECPVLVQLGDRDVTAPRRATETFVKRAPRGVLSRYDLSHFDPFDKRHQPQLATDQARWLHDNV